MMFLLGIACHLVPSWVGTTDGEVHTFFQCQMSPPTRQQLWSWAMKAGHIRFQI